MTEVIRIAQSSDDVAAVKAMFREYADQLDFSIEFQDFEGEMRRFPIGYETLIVARIGGVPAGAVGLKHNSDGVCELKRLFVRPEARATGLGRRLCERLMHEARGMGYREMWLNTLIRWKAAHALYLKLGFTEAEPFEFHTQSDIVYLKQRL